MAKTEALVREGKATLDGLRAKAEKAGADARVDAQRKIKRIDAYRKIKELEARYADVPRRSAWPGKNAHPCLIADAATNPDNVLLLKGCDAGIARLPQSTVTYGLRNVTIENSLEVLQAPKLQPWPAPVGI